MSSSENMATTTLAFIAGVSAGIAAGVLFAPRAGKDTRDQLQKKAYEARAKAQQKMEDERDMLKGHAEDVKDKARKIAEEGRHLAKDVAKDIKARADERGELAKG